MIDSITFVILLQSTFRPQNSMKWTFKELIISDDLLNNQTFFWAKCHQISLCKCLLTVRASTKSPLCGGSSGCHDDSAMKNTSTVRCIGQDKARGNDGYSSKAAAAKSYERGARPVEQACSIEQDTRGRSEGPDSSLK